MRNLTSVILNILTYFINPPVCSQFSISATTSSPAWMHSPPCWALPFHPQLPWPQCHSAWALTHHTWLPLHVDTLLVLAELWNPIFPTLTCGNPPYSAWESVPRPVILINGKISSFYEIEELCFYQFLMLRLDISQVPQSQNYDNLARSPPYCLILFSFTKDHIFLIC